MFVTSKDQSLHGARPSLTRALPPVVQGQFLAVLLGGADAGRKQAGAGASVGNMGEGTQGSSGGGGGDDLGKATDSDEPRGSLSVPGHLEAVVVDTHAGNGADAARNAAVSAGVASLATPLVALTAQTPDASWMQDLQEHLAGRGKPALTAVATTPIARDDPGGYDYPGHPERNDLGIAGSGEDLHWPLAARAGSVRAAGSAREGAAPAGAAVRLLPAEATFLFMADPAALTRPLDGTSKHGLDALTDGQAVYLRRGADLAAGREGISNPKPLMTSALNDAGLTDSVMLAAGRATDHGMAQRLSLLPGTDQTASIAPGSEAQNVAPRQLLTHSGSGSVVAQEELVPHRLSRTYLATAQSRNHALVDDPQRAKHLVFWTALQDATGAQPAVRLGEQSGAKLDAEWQDIIPGRDGPGATLSGLWSGSAMAPPGAGNDWLPLRHYVDGKAQIAAAAGGDGTMPLRTDRSDAAPPPMTLSQPPGSPVSYAGVAVAPGLRVQILEGVRKGRSVVEINLAPAELGRLRITLRPAETGMQLFFQADRPETLDMIRRHAADLALDLRALGYEQLDLSFAQSDDGSRGSGDGAGPTGAQLADMPEEQDIPVTGPRGDLEQGGMDMRL